MREENGATMVEYGFLLAGIAIIVAVALTALGPAAANLYAGVLSWL